MPPATQQTDAGAFSTRYFEINPFFKFRLIAGVIAVCTRGLYAAARYGLWSGGHVQACEGGGGALIAQSDGEKLTRIGRDPLPSAITKPRSGHLFTHIVQTQHRARCYSATVYVPLTPRQLHSSTPTRPSPTLLPTPLVNTHASLPNTPSQRQHTHFTHHGRVRQ
jgi:hypothetical protein